MKFDEQYNFHEFTMIRFTESRSFFKKNAVWRSCNGLQFGSWTMNTWWSDPKTIYQSQIQYGLEIPASSCTDLDNACFWKRSKKLWDTQMNALKTLRCMVFWCSCLCLIKWLKLHKFFHYPKIVYLKALLYFEYSIGYLLGSIQNFLLAARWETFVSPNYTNENILKYRC